MRVAACAVMPAGLGATARVGERRPGRLGEPSLPSLGEPSLPSLGEPSLSDANGLIAEPNRQLGKPALPDALGAPVRVVTLGAELDHPQGIEVSADEQTWWVSSVHRPRKAGLLGAFNAETGATRLLVEIHEGPCYHPGGLSRHHDELWVPVAEYRRASRTLVQRRDASTLARRSTFEVGDHIGCVAADATRLVGANWDARTFYAWDRNGREQARVENPTPARYQDLKWDGETLVAGGLLDDHGVIDRLAWPSLVLLARVVVGRTDRDVVLTHEGLALTATALVLMPEDDPVRVFVFPRPRRVW